MNSHFLWFSGTGKQLYQQIQKKIGDDEHGWTSENTVFNFEGGCYAKVINLSEESEPISLELLKRAILENVVLKKGQMKLTSKMFHNTNTRVSYPIYHIDNIQPSSIGKIPKTYFPYCRFIWNITSISKLTPGQAAYHFISGYAKVAGTEEVRNHNLISLLVLAHHSCHFIQQSMLKC
jgi:phosphoenolpyruvate carboxykinase (ATP)